MDTLDGMTLIKKNMNFIPRFTIFSFTKFFYNTRAHINNADIETYQGHLYYQQLIYLIYFFTAKKREEQLS